MRILIDNQVLAEGPHRGNDGEPCGPTEIRLNDRIIPDEKNAIRAAARALFNRGNQATTIEFDVAREHASVQDAEVFFLTHPKTLTRNGTLTLESRSEYGAVASMVFEGCVIVTTAHRYTGVRTYHTYTCEGGVIEGAGRTLPGRSIQ